MKIIELNKRNLNFPKLDDQGTESVIYVNNDILYKIFNSDLNLKIRKDIVEFIDDKKDKLEGLILPEEELAYNNKFVGYTMKKYDLKTIDKFFNNDIEYRKRYNYALKFVDLFNRMNSLGIEYMDFHTDNIFIDKDDNPLMGDVSCIRQREVGSRGKKEQLKLIVSLLCGYDLMNYGNDIVLDEIINTFGNKELVDYYYDPKDNISTEMIEDFGQDNKKTIDIVTKFGPI